MGAKRSRRVIADIAVCMFGAALCAWPFIATGSASLSDVPVNVNQKVAESTLISKPLDGKFDVKLSGRSTGSIDWDVYTSSTEGFKLSVSASTEPAMTDTTRGAVIGDLSSSFKPWSVAAGERRFGFSATGDQAKSSFANGDNWRGFTGRKSIELGRRKTGPVKLTRTTLLLSSEMRAALPAGATPRVTITGTTSVNL